MTKVTGFPLTGLIDGLRGIGTSFVIGEDNKVERRSVQVLFANNQQAYVSSTRLGEGEQVISVVYIVWFPAKP
ncbi:hypothetical protein O9993_12320 [Vibrio lentus]|nr:hypothetical protein [Vibrio lentus]